MTTTPTQMPTMRPDRQLLRLRLVLHRLLLIEWGERRRRDDDEAGRGEDGDAQHGGGGLGGAELGLDEVARAVALHARGHGDSGGDEHAAGLDDDGHERLVDAAATVAKFSCRLATTLGV